jgi:Domain of unknown function (DUF4406)
VRIYVAGPITALEKDGMTLDQIKASFAGTADYLRQLGHDPVNPFELHPMGVSWEQALRADITGLVTCEAIYYRKGWRSSPGVKLERYIARALGFKEIYEDPAEEKARGGSERFHQILEELGQLHDKKQRDYGRSNDPFANVRSTAEFGVPAWVGAMIRGNDKIQRVKSLIANGRLENESLEDSLRDLAVYAVIALVLWEEGQVKSND